MKTTGNGTHRATQRGYAGGEIIEEGRLVPPGTPVSDKWMERVKKGGEELARAVEEAQDPQPDDIDLEQLEGDALTAHAAQFGINRGRLNDKNLRTAVRAAYDKDRAQ